MFPIISSHSSKSYQQFVPLHPFPFRRQEREEHKNRLTLLGILWGPTSETMLQQLMSSCGAGSCHQAHSGLMQENLEK